MLPACCRLLVTAFCLALSATAPSSTRPQSEQRRAEASSLPTESIPTGTLEVEEDDACSGEAGTEECALSLHQLRGSMLESRAASQKEVDRHTVERQPIETPMGMMSGVPLYEHPSVREVFFEEATNPKDKQWILNLQVEHSLRDKSLQDGPDPTAHAQHVVVFRGSKNELETEIGSHPNVLFVEEDTLMRMVPELESMPEREMRTLFSYGYHAGYHPHRQNNNPPSWGLDRIDAKEGLDHWYEAAGYGGAGVHAYVLDTGIMRTHEDFGGRVIPTLEVDHKGLRVCQSKDPTCAMDELGHGTHTAGTIGGRRFGVAKGITLHACKTLDHKGTGMISWMISALDWVSANGTRPSVVSASLGGPYDSPSLERSIDRTVASGITVVVAGGNENDDACKYTPAKVKSAITVGAIEVGDMRASYSNWGKCLDIFAPGSFINSLGIDSNTSMSTMSGTSMACPHVAGVVALLLAQDQRRTPDQVRQLLLKNAAVKHGPIDSVSEEEDALDIYYVRAEQRDTINVKDKSESPVQRVRAHGSPKLLLYTKPRAPRPMLSKWPPRFEIYDGTCRVDSEGCVSSDGFGKMDTYGNNQVCNVLVLGDVGHVHVESFETEASFDVLTVNSVRYSGSITGAASLLECVRPTGAVTWASDRTNAKSGWKVCPEQRPTSSSAPGFHVGCGRCQRDAEGCITSPNWPGNYSNYGSCYIEVVGDVPRVMVDAFNTEANYDMLWVNGKNYSGTDGPHDVWPGSKIVWKSDADEVSQGWRICPQAA